MTIRLTDGANNQGKAVDEHGVLAALVKQASRLALTGLTDVTDSSGGTATTSVVAMSTALTNVADAGSTLASKATAESALTTVLAALNELAAKANAAAVALGLPAVTYNAGGGAPNNTIEAITVSTTGATTGAQAAATNAVIANLNAATYTVTQQINKVLKATGYATVPVFAGSFQTTVPAITVDVGTAASPGVTKVALDAELVKARANIATLAAKVNAFNAGYGVPLVVVG